MEHLTANLVGSVRRAKLHGRDHLVVPVTLIVPGVLNGSQGPLYYPPEEVGKDPAIWNGIPVVVNHPIKDGKHLSARTPDVLESQGVGHLFATKANGKLQAEAWIDTARAQKVDNRLLPILENGRSVESSTGVFVEEEPAAQNAAHEGKPYRAIARNYRPDHLAVLLDTTGACSVADGCGLNVNEETKQTIWGKLAALVGMTSNTKTATKAASTKKESEKMNAQDRTKMIEFIVANCGWCDEADRPALNELSEEKLTAMHDEIKAGKAERELVANATKGFTDPQGNRHAWNVDTKAWETKTKEPEPVANEDKTAKPPTAEEWMAQAPSEIREDLTFARAEKAKQKTALIDRLLVNVADDQRANHRSRLEARSLAELEDDVKLVPQPEPAANWAGAVGAPELSTASQSTPFGLPGEY
jgi:hypothetical protein